MKKIINGMSYNTETAQMMGRIQYGGRGDSGFWAEELYRTRKGSYFLYGTGGAMSKYARRYSDNSWGGGEEIRPMTVEEARKWAEDNLSGDEYEEIFGPVEEA